MSVRATGLVNFRGDPYITRPELEELIGGSLENLVAVKPFTFTAADMTPGNGVPVALSIVIPGIVFHVFRNDVNEVSYGNIEYLSGDDAGKTRFTIDDYEGEGIATTGTPTPFTALAIVASAGGVPIQVLPSEDLGGDNP